jgi:photosystem II stability/assembly factor-like uncharacterized protein
MNKQLRTLVAFCAIGVTTAAVPAFCADPETLRVTVPFAFRAGRANLPAGNYTVVESDSHTVMIRGSRGSAILLSTTGGEEGDSDKNALSFRHTDKGYFLKAVYAAGRPSNLFPVSPETEQ